MEHKCTGPCGQVKHESDFHVYPGSKRRNAWCKACQRENSFGSRASGGKKGRFFPRTIRYEHGTK